MSTLRNRMIGAASRVALPAGILAMAMAAGCNQDSKEPGSGGEPPPEMEAPEGGDDPASAGAAPSGDDPGGGAPPADEAQAGGGAPPAGEAQAGGGAPPAGGQAGGGAPPAGGQAGGQPGMGGGVSDEPLTDEQLDSFAEAYIEVEDVQKGLEEEFSAAESKEEANKIQQEAINKIRETVEETGMDFETYGMIAQRLQQDPELIERVEKRIDDER